MKKEWLIKKGGYFYRPNKCGYTTSKLEAGRYTKEDAEREAAVEPCHMSAIHESDVPDPPMILSAGYRIVGPGELDAVTLEKAARVADQQGHVDWEDGDGGQYGHGYESACGDIAIEIRSLTATHLSQSDTKESDLYQRGDKP